MSKKGKRTEPMIEPASTEKRRRLQSPIRNPQSEIRVGNESSNDARNLFALGLLTVLILYVAHSAYLWAYVNDDAYITFRYSRFLSMGRGPYYNIGEHVEGYTNFLLMLLLTPIIGLFGESSAAPFAKCLGIACGGLALVSVSLLVRRVDRGSNDSPIRGTTAAILAPALVAVSPSYTLNSTSGLETMLFAGCLSLGLLLGHLSLEKGRWRGAGIAFACATLTRPEGILLFAIYWFAQLIVARGAVIEFIRDLAKRGRAAWPSHRLVVGVFAIDAIIVVGVFAAHLVFRLIAYDGEWLPNTYYAKAGGFWKVDAASYIRAGALKPFFDSYGIGVGIAVIGWLFSGSTRRRTIPLFFIATIGTLLPFVTGSDWMLGFRLLMPFLPALAGIVAIGWCRIASFVVRQPRWLGPPLVLLCVPLLWYLQTEYRTFLHDYSEARARGYEKGHTALAKWLRAGAAQKGDTVALMDIGIVGYLCVDQNILDITGLTDRAIAKSQGRFMDKRYDPAYVVERKPEFIVLVFGGKGNPDVPPPAGTRIKPWSKNEARIWDHPEVQSHYVRRRPVPPNAAHWTDIVAAQLGAERVFEHAHPGRYYLLAVFRRSHAEAPTTRPVPGIVG